jgi:hypothetical protein
MGSWGIWSCFLIRCSMMTKGVWGLGRAQGSSSSFTCMGTELLYRWKVSLGDEHVDLTGFEDQLRSCRV